MIAKARFGLVITEADLQSDLLSFFELAKQGMILELSRDTALVGRSYLADLLRPQLSQVRFDSSYYREKNEDLRKAEERGELSDLHSHYINFGFFENRLPCAVEVDTAFYTSAYPDVAAAVLKKETPSCQVHFETMGFAEGRLPSSGWRFSDLMNG